MKKMLENIDFKKDRPFIELSYDVLKSLSDKCFEDGKLDLEIATLIYEELKLRKSSNSKKLLSEIKLKFSLANHEPIKWLKEARKVIKTIKKVDASPKYTNSIYTILRDGYTDKNQKYGVYVGQTSKTIEERFKEHKSGINDGRGLKKHGIQLLRSLWLHSKVRRSKRLCYETKVHKKLEEVVPKVSGDVKSDEVDNG